MNRTKAPSGAKSWTKSWTRTAGVLFLAASAVYNGRAIAAGAAKTGNPAVAAIPGGTTTVDVKPIADDASTAPATATNASTDSKNTPAKDASAKDAAAATTQPTTQPSAGKSVSASEVAVSKDAGTVEIHVNDANIVEVLRMLSMQSNTNILPSKDVRGTVTVNLYDMTIKEALDAILKANGFGYKEKGNVIYVYSAKEIADQEKGDHKLNTEVFRLYYTPAVNAQTMIKPVMSGDGQVAVTTPANSGIDTSAKDSGGNTHAIEDMLVITDYPENLDRVRKILKDIDRRPQQILVEATILRCSLTEDNALGVDFQLLGGVDFHSLTNAGASVADVLSGNVLNNGTALKEAGPNFGSAATGFTQNVPTGGLRAGVITNNVAVFVAALEEVTNTVVMANPKVLVLNKQRGEVKVARQDPFRGKTTVSETGLTQQEVDFLETGTMLIFRPFIGDDGYIRMEVHPEDSTPLAARSSDLPPTKLTTETTTNIMVKDGHTIVIGGLFRETSQSTKSQIPLLGNIPLIGYLFRNQADSTQREEVIILLTPHIIHDEAQFSKMSEAQLKEAERLRVGVRQGMMPIGRERLAECCYETAVKEWNKPHPNRHMVLWHLDCAINLNPTFLEAIDLKAKVTGREVTTADNSSIRDFVRHLAMTDVAVPASGPGAAEAPATSTPQQPTAAATAAPTATPTTQPSSTGDSAQASTPTTPSAVRTTPPAKTVEVTDEEFFEEYPMPAYKPSSDDKSKIADAGKPTTQPTTQPSPEVAKTDSGSKADKSTDPAADPTKTDKADPKKDDVTVTELPVEEVKDEPEKSDK
jgi:type IV pilus assembly protein PilQ